MVLVACCSLLIAHRWRDDRLTYAIVDFDSAAPLLGLALSVTGIAGVRVGIAGVALVSFGVSDGVEVAAALDISVCCITLALTVLITH